ncbi:hypothetical protein M3210_18700 [Oceanobacillus luteolus]|uniref:Uncharacterized protein n=1 Tax=Oceanobacillus luteolus TaxID=1274358 RepID=A0ABW4HV69_9BACI|nr:hypothetical protein [Oceanobacillus luteolus]
MKFYKKVAIGGGWKELFFNSFIFSHLDKLIENGRGVDSLRMVDLHFVFTILK